MQQVSPSVMPHQRAVTSADRPGQLPLAQGVQFHVTHQILDQGVPIPLAQADRLQTSVMDVFDVLFHSLVRQIESGVGDLNLRARVRTILMRTVCGMSAQRLGEVTVAYYARKNTITVVFSLDERWSVVQRLVLVWRGRNGVALAHVDCQTITKVPGPERRDCAAWFDSRRIRLENHFTKRLAGTCTGAEA